MNKRKPRTGYCRKKRKVSKPRSTDSGVSLKSSPNLNNNARENFNISDSCTLEGTSGNLINSSILKDIVEPISETLSKESPKLAPTLKSLAVIEDENCLDYEPSEDEDDTPTTSNNKRLAKDNDQLKMNDGNIRVLPIADLKKPFNEGRITDRKLSNNVGSIPTTSNNKRLTKDNDQLKKNDGNIRVLPIADLKKPVSKGRITDRKLSNNVGSIPNLVDLKKPVNMGRVTDFKLSNNVGSIPNIVELKKPVNTGRITDSKLSNNVSSIPNIIDLKKPVNIGRITDSKLSNNVGSTTNTVQKPVNMGRNADFKMSNNIGSIPNIVDLKKPVNTGRNNDFKMSINVGSIPNIVDLKEPVNMGRITDCKLSNNIGFIPNAPPSLDESNTISADGSYNENMIMENDMTHKHSKMDEEIFEEDFDSDEESEYAESRPCEDDGSDPVNSLFGNAKVHFNGPLNITITRPTTNKPQNQVPPANKYMMPNLEVPPSACNPPNVRIHNVSTLLPEENMIGETTVSNRKWPYAVSPINCQRATLNDDIFSNNANRYELLEEINSKVPDEEDIISEHTRSSSSDGNAFLKGNEYDLQENDKEAFVARWLMHNNEDNFTKLLNSLCESHFNKVCNNLRCPKTHSLEEIKKIIHRASTQEFQEYYQTTLKKHLWFTWLFDFFLDCFSVIPNTAQMMLIDMISDIHKVFDGTLTDKTSYIVKIIQSLQKIGLTFKQAIKQIILRYGTTQLWICDILLFIIASEPNLEDHWCLVQKITCCRKEKIDHKVVIELLNVSFEKNPLNEEFCLRIFCDIFEKDLVDMTKIPSHFRSCIRKLAGNLAETQMNFVSSNSVKNGEEGGSRPTTAVSMDIRGETLRTNGGYTHLQDESIVMTRNISESDASVRIMEVRDGDSFNKREKLRHHHKGYSPKKQSKSLKAQRYNLPNASSFSSSRTVNNRVLKKVINSLEIIPKPQSPANVIAHPSYQPMISLLYQCNISLHNLLPNVQRVLTDLTPTDLHRLKNTLKDEDTAEFLDLMLSYSDMYSIENFIVNVLTLLKSISYSSVKYSIVMSILNALDKRDRNHPKEMYIKVTLEVLALNLIYMLNVKGHYTLARNILFNVKDWHSLVTSKVFVGKKNLKSHMGRYIYIIELLTKTGDFSWANEIFQAEALNLLGPAPSWFYKYTPSDTNDRNNVLEFFLGKCFPQNIFITNDLLKHIVLVYGGSVDGFDIWTWFNKKILSLIEEGDSKKSILLLLSGDIYNYYEKYMNKYVLQAYMLYMVNCVTGEMSLNLFQKCCCKGIYKQYTGEERIVHISTNYTDFEITSLLQCYFEGFRTGRVSPHDFCIDLKLPDMTLNESTFTDKFRVNRTVYKVFEIICNILDSKFGIKIDQPVLSTIFVSLSK